jgi:hypothetical protein
MVRGTDPGDEVEVWFTAENRRRSSRDDIESRAFTYSVRSDSGARVLVLAQEYYTGSSAFPAYPSTEGPFYLDYSTDALEANGVDYDVYDLERLPPVLPETDLGGWEVPGAHPEGPAENLNDWIRSEVIFEEAAATRTDEGLVFGFGFEGVNTAEARALRMRRTLGHLLPSG